MIARRGDDPDDDLDDGDPDDDLDADDEDGAASSADTDLDEDDDLDDDFPLGEGVADTAAEVWCPYCGEPSEIVVDPGGGNLQRYVEDCPVCCRPWQVTVHFASDGTVTVAADADDASLDDMD
ncbi:MAG: CPXCG motif-containing cysteine-rich protein [Gemmatimonadaceae bacterium]